MFMNLEGISSFIEDCFADSEEKKMDKKDKKASTSELILRQTCLRAAVELHGSKAPIEKVLKTADEFVRWVVRK